MFGYIYMSRNKETGLIYVGQKKSDIFLGNKYLGSGKLLKEAVSKYGRDAFEVILLEEVDHESQMKAREEFWITKLHATDRSIGYNITTNGQVNRNPGLSGELNPFYGKHHTEETRKKMREAQSHRSSRSKHTEETKDKIRQALLGRNITWGDKISANAQTNPNYGMRGKTCSDAAKKKLSDRQKEIWNNLEYRTSNSEKVKECWTDPEYRRKHVESMRGKKKKITYKKCPYCGKSVNIGGNYNSHVATHERSADKLKAADCKSAGCESAHVGSNPTSPTWWD